jgi:hypothetical protein
MRSAVVVAFDATGSSMVYTPKKTERGSQRSFHSPTLALACQEEYE